MPKTTHTGIKTSSKISGNSEEILVSKTCYTQLIYQNKSNCKNVEVLLLVIRKQIKLGKNPLSK